MTKQIPSISTGSVYQEEAVVLAIVLTVSLLMMVLNLRKEKDTTPNEG
jgi:hypothetical protein